jgi:multiple sugar transport system permease protein
MAIVRTKNSVAIWQVLALLLSALYVVPMLYIVMTSLTPGNEPVGQVPSHLVFSNYIDAFAASDFGVFLFNSVVVALVSTAIQLVLSCAAGYALARLPLPASNLILMLLVALLVVPPEIVMVPLFVMAKSMPLVGGNDIMGQGGQGLIDSLPGLMVPHVVSALGIFLMRQFYKDLPEELGDSARMDGASELRIFAGIYTPLVIPAAAIVGIFAFQSAWNDFLWPLVMTRSMDMQTLQLGLTVFFQENSTQWNLLMAVVLTISLPVLILFLFIQRYFRADVMSGAIK